MIQTINMETRDKANGVLGMLKSIWEKDAVGKIVVVVLGVLLWPFILLILCTILYHKFDKSLKRQFAIGLLLVFTLPLTFVWIWGIASIFSGSRREIYKAGYEKGKEAAQGQGVLSSVTTPATSISPTDESVSTSTPEPTIVPTQPVPKVSPVNAIIETGVYLAKMLEITNSVTDAMGKIGDFMTENPDFTSWTDEQRVYFVLLASIIEKSYKEVQSVKPPVQYRESYNLVLTGLQKYAQAMPLTRQGIDERNADKIYRAVSLIEAGGELFNKATAQFAIDNAQ